MSYKFQELTVYKMALEYIDQVYRLSSQLPKGEWRNLRIQVERAATSIALNIAEGSKGQSDAEQKRFLGLAVRSYLETVACCDLIELRNYLSTSDLNKVREFGHQLFIKLQAFRASLKHRTKV